MIPRPFGSTGLSVTPLCIGTSALGNFPAQYGYEVSDERAAATLRRVFQGPINFIDTSNEYGGGESERRIGRVLKQLGGIPTGFVLATKVDPLPGSRDFSGARIRASVAESLQRLGLDQLQVVYLHDPEKITFAEAMAPGGAVEALIRLRDEGIIKYLGVAGGPIDLMLQYVGTGAFETVISHNRYTLVDQSAEPLLTATFQRGIAFVNAAPYGGGMLVKGPSLVPEVLLPASKCRDVSPGPQDAADLSVEYVPLAAAALQFSLREKRIVSTIVGITEPERVEQTLQLAAWPIPESVWQDLEPLIVAGKAGVL